MNLEKGMTFDVVLCTGGKSHHSNLFNGRIGVKLNNAYFSCIMVKHKICKYAYLHKSEYRKIGRLIVKEVK